MPLGRRTGWERPCRLATGGCHPSGSLIPGPVEDHGRGQHAGNLLRRQRPARPIAAYQSTCPVHDTWPGRRLIAPRPCRLLGRSHQCWRSGGFPFTPVDEIWVCCGGSWGRRRPRSRGVSGVRGGPGRGEEGTLLRAQGAGVREIGRWLGSALSTISRELRRNAATRGGKLDYRASAGSTNGTPVQGPETGWRTPLFLITLRMCGGAQGGGSRRSGKLLMPAKVSLDPCR